MGEQQNEEKAPQKKRRTVKAIRTEIQEAIESHEAEIIKLQKYIETETAELESKRGFLKQLEGAE